jgi:hypothetical protein
MAMMLVLGPNHLFLLGAVFVLGRVFVGIEEAFRGFHRGGTCSFYSARYGLREFVSSERGRGLFIQFHGWFALEQDLPLYRFRSCWGIFSSWCCLGLAAIFETRINSSQEGRPKTQYGLQTCGRGTQKMQATSQADASERAGVPRDCIALRPPDSDYGSRDRLLHRLCPQNRRQNPKLVNKSCTVTSC